MRRARSLNQIPEATIPLFRRFFGDEFGIPEERVSVPAWIHFEPGWSLSVTNAHVVAEAGTVQATLKDGRSFEERL